MSDPTSYGLIVEGPYDKQVYEGLIPRICSADLLLVTRLCGGVTNLMKLFPAFLREFEHLLNGQPVDKALVIRDAEGIDIQKPRIKMEEKIKGCTYAFPLGVQLCVVRQEMETWLLADIGAINAVATARGGRKISELHRSPEDIHDPKRELRSLLSRAQIELTAPVCREVASKLNIETLEYRCPSFRTFKRSVLDC